MDLAFILYLKLKANRFGFYFLKRKPNLLDLDTFLMKSKSAILDFSFRQLKSKNPKPIQTFVARGADPSLYNLWYGSLKYIILKIMYRKGRLFKQDTKLRWSTESKSTFSKIWSLNTAEITWFMECGKRSR